MICRGFLAILLLLLCCPVAAQAEPVKTAVFGFEFFDDTMDARPDIVAAQKSWLAHANAELLAMVVASGEMTPVDLAPLASRITELAPFYKCNGCEEDLARAAGAQLEVLGVVRKVSNLILSFSLQVREVAAPGRVLRAGQVEIRGNTEESWLRGVRYLMKNRILAPGQAPLAP